MVKYTRMKHLNNKKVIRWTPQFLLIRRLPWVKWAIAAALTTAYKTDKVKISTGSDPRMTDLGFVQKYMYFKLYIVYLYKMSFLEVLLKIYLKNKFRKTPVRKKKEIIKRKCKIIYNIQLLQITTTNHIKYIKIINLHL